MCTFSIRSGPQGYMETIVDLELKLFDKKKFEELYYEDWSNDPVQEWINNLLLNKMLEAGIKTAEDKKKEEEEKKTKEAKKDEGLLEALVKKFEFKKPQFLDKKPAKPKGFLASYKISSPYDLDGTLFKVKKEMKLDLAIVYFVIKKGFGMFGELQMYK
jgi:hypothetical protein